MRGSPTHCFCLKVAREFQVTMPEGPRTCTLRDEKIKYDIMFTVTTVKHYILFYQNETNGDGRRRLLFTRDSCTARYCCERVLAMAILPVCLSRPFTDSRPGEIQTPGFHHMVA